MGAGETVIWNGSLRSHTGTAAGGDDMDAGSAYAPSATFTDGGSGGADGTLYKTAMTLDWDNGTNNLVAGDLCAIALNRNFSGDTYGSDAIIMHVVFRYPTTSLKTER